MDWFLRHGDKLLIGLGVTLNGLTSSGVLNASPWLGAVAGILAVLHTTLLPNPAPPSVK